MSLRTILSQKITDKETLARLLAAKKLTGNKIVFTNGCFDLLHPGHIRYLADARSLGDFLVVGLNSEHSAMCAQRITEVIVSRMEAYIPHTFSPSRAKKL